MDAVEEKADQVESSIVADLHELAHECGEYYKALRKEGIPDEDARQYVYAWHQERVKWR